MRSPMPIAELKRQLTVGSVWSVENHYITSPEHPCFGTHTRTVVRSSSANYEFDNDTKQGGGCIPWPKSGEVMLRNDGAIEIYGHPGKADLFLTLRSASTSAHTGGSPERRGAKPVAGPTQGRESRRDSPERTGISQPKAMRYILWALPSGSTDRLDEMPLTSFALTRDEAAKVEQAASRDGWHGFRLASADGQPDFVSAINL